MEHFYWRICSSITKTTSRLQRMLKVGQGDDDVLRYYTNICAVCENWETESETSCDVAVRESDEHEVGAGEWWVNLVALSYQVEDESAVVDGERESATDDAGEWEAEWGLLATVETAAAEANTATGTTTASTTTTMEVEQGLMAEAVVVVEERQGMGEIGEKGGMADNNNDNNNNNNINNNGEQRMGELDETGLKEDNNNNNNNEMEEMG
ncbi:hypothetical protein CBR_g8808 [Chara braunii]|uniref:Uncharacterized protein n=1 Tax=Chara braunii TaxID=69332 RepID=A0A388KN13_CHABU|nr:hypothetical protein CBR_g8808 [Chara braunii]|eukprot:GBG71388.1 hypothetical protein CBR_g8808 [Chara braunii]